MSARISTELMVDRERGARRASHWGVQSEVGELAHEHECWQWLQEESVMPLESRIPAYDFRSPGQHSSN